MDQTFILRHDYRFSDLVRQTVRLMPKLRLVRRIAAFLVIAAVVGAVVGYAVRRSWEVVLLNLFIPLWLLVLFFGIAPVLFLVLYYRLQPTRFRGIEYRFNHWGMEKVEERGRFTRPWDGFVHAEENDHEFLLYVNHRDAHVILKNAFPDDASRDSFRSLLRSKGLL